MATSKTTLQLEVTADAGKAVAGLTPLETSLNEVKASSESAEKSLNDLATPHPVNVNDAEIKKVQAEITRLRIEMRDAIRLDVDANTTEARAKIRALQATERELKKPVVIPVTTVGTGQAEAKLAGLNGQVTSMFPSLSKATGGFKGMGAAAGGAAAAYGAFKATSIAGDMELLAVQLDSVFGNGEQVLDMLRSWATEAPFGLDATANSARTLGLAGIDLKDMPGILDDIGTAASLAGGNLDENLEGISLVVSQMLNKGKITAEEMQQLAERQVPAWQALAESQGTSVAEVQKLVTASKLGREDVKAFLDQLKADNPNAMADAAETLTGKMSTLKDTFNQQAADLGKVWLPGVKIAIDALIDLTGAAGDVASAVHDIVPIDPRAFGGIFGVISLVHDAVAGTDDATDAQKKLDAALDGTRDSAQDTGGSIDQHLLPSLAETKKTAEEAATAFQTMVDGFSAVNEEALTGRDAINDYEGAIDDLRAGLQTAGTFSPDVEQGRTNWSNLEEVARSSSARILQTFKTHGVSAAMDMDQTIRSQLHGMLTTATGNSQQAWNIVNRVMKTPVELRLELSRLQQAKVEQELTATIHRLSQKSVNLKAKVGVLPDDAVNQRVINQIGAANQIDVKVKALTDDADKDLADLTNPQGQARTAPIKAQIDPDSLSSARTIFHNLTLPETKTITVRVVSPGTGLSNTFSGGINQPGGSGFGPSAQTAPTQMAPKSTPIKVLLDGAEIADHLELNARRLASAGSTRRLP